MGNPPPPNYYQQPAYQPPPPNYQQPAYGPPPPYGPPVNQQSSKPIVAGILMILSAIMSFISGAQILLLDAAMYDMFPGGQDISGILAAIGAICFIFGIVQLIGGIMSIRRRMWGVALLGAIVALISIGFVFIGSVFGLIALIFIALSKDEFQ